MEIKLNYTIENNLIVMTQRDYWKRKQVLDWAKQQIDLYHVFNSGIIKCKTESAISFFLLKYPQSECMI